MQSTCVYTGIHRASGLALALLFAVLPSAYAQRGELSGIVTDPADAAVANATVTLRQPATGQRLSTRSNSTGLYLFASLEPGSYELTVEAEGFEVAAVRDLLVNVAARLRRDIALHVGANVQTLTVDGAAAPLSVSEATVSTVVNRTFVESVPLSGRSFQSLMTLAPGVTVVPSQGAGTSGEISVNGQRTESNYFTVDGVSATNGVSNTGTIGFSAGYAGSTAGETALGTTHNMVSLDALSEFRAATSSYSAEYGRTPGGQFTFTTRAGANRWSGSLFEYFRNDALNANGWFGNATGTGKPAERQNDFGGTLGGAIRRDRTFFFLTHESLRLRSPQAGVTTQVPNAALRASTSGTLQAVLNSFPQANGSDAGTGVAAFTAGYSNPSHLDTTALRIDHAVTDTFRLFGRFGYSPSESEAHSTTNLAQTVSTSAGAKPLTIGATQIFSARLTNDFRFNTTWSDSGLAYSSTNFGGATPFSVNSVPILASSPYNRLNVLLNWGLKPTLSFLPQDITQRQLNLVDTANFVAGRHNLKFGIDYRVLHNSAHVPPIYNPVTYASAAEVTANTPSSHAVATFSLAYLKPIYKNFSAFMQDEWHPTDRLTVSAGLRWDVNPAPRDADGNDPYTVDQIGNLGATTLAPKGTQLWNTTWANFAPRLGLAYQLGRRSGWETLARVGGGLFFDMGNTFASNGYGRVGYRTTARFNKSAFPITASQFASIAAPSTTPPYTEAVLTVDPNLKLPYVWQWSATVEQGLGSRQSLSLAYVGSRSHRLLTTRIYSLNLYGNSAFVANGLYLTTNHGAGQYDGLQARFQRDLARGLQVLASYAWSHAIDNSTTNFTLYQLLRASSDYDVRHNFQAGLSWRLPGRHAWTRDWEVDARVSARSSLPVDITSATGTDPGTYIQLNFHPNRVASQPLYVSDSNSPGGRRINYAAYTSAGTNVEGNAGRNSARGFAATQFDLALRRQFSVSERLKLQLRAEAFNALNHPIFGAIYSQLSNGESLFGRAYNTLNTQLGGLNSLYQGGGARSMQLSLRLSF